MRKRQILSARKRQLLAATAALAVTPFVGAPASAATCVSAPVASYETGGSLATCSYDGVTFSNLSINSTTTGSGVVALGNLTPFQTTIAGTTEIGLTLNYTGFTGTTGGTADVTWMYTASGNMLTDAYLALASTLSGTGKSGVDEIFSNGQQISLSAPGTSNVITFTAIGSLGVTKDQDNFAGSGSSSFASALSDGFSLTATPIPATLPLLATGLAGLWGVSRKRRKGSRLGSAQAS